MTKICSKCGIEKPLDQFHKETRGKFGVKSKCAQCILESTKAWKATNPQREQENRKRWNADNKDRHREDTYRWRKEHYWDHCDYVAKYQRERKSIDPKFKLLSNLRSLMYNHLTRRDLMKHDNLETYLGCRFDEFHAHIACQFDSSMSWDNYGSYWSVDHICPCDQAKTEDELVKLQHYSNTRPMRTRGPGGNFAKSNKKTPEAEEKCLQLLGRLWID